MTAKSRYDYFLFHCGMSFDARETCTSLLRSKPEVSRGWLRIKRFSNFEKIPSAILPLASNILFPLLPFRLFSNLFSVTMLALLLRISSKIAQKCRCKIAELILSTLLKTLLLGAGVLQVANVVEVEHVLRHPFVGFHWRHLPSRRASADNFNQVGPFARH